MLHHQIRLSRPWIKIRNPLKEILTRLALADDQEEAELYLYRLYVENETDLQFFDAEDRVRVTGFLRLLMDDTRQHQELIAQIAEEIKLVLEVEHGQGTA